MSGYHVDAELAAMAMSRSRVPAADLTRDIGADRAAIARAASERRTFRDTGAQVAAAAVVGDAAPAGAAA